MTKFEQISKLIDAGYTKAEIDALMIDNEVNNVASVEPSNTDNDSNVKNSKEPEQITEQNNELEQKKEPDNGSISNSVLLTAINNLTTTIQTMNRNTVTSDGNVTENKETVTDILTKCLK